MQPLLNDLAEALRLRPGAGDQAYGEVHGSPFTMTVLGAEPPALLFAFPIHPPRPLGVVLPPAIDAGLRETSGSVSIENGIAWLSLDNLSSKPADWIAAFVDQFGVALADLGLCVPPGCLKCGGFDNVSLVYVNRRCSRICAACLDDIEEEVKSKVAEAVRPHVGFAAAMPLAFLGVSCVWAAVWFCLEMYLEAQNIRLLAVPELVPLLAFLGALAAGIGWPFGWFLRRSGLARINPVWVSVVAVIFACIVGEWLFVNALVVHETGIFAPVAATQSFLPYVTRYQSSWMIAKIIVAGAIVLGCALAARVRPTIEAPSI
jgi:hypothetical protein